MSASAADRTRRVQPHPRAVQEVRAGLVERGGQLEVAVLGHHRAQRAQPLEREAVGCPRPRACARPRRSRRGPSRGRRPSRRRASPSPASRPPASPARRPPGGQAPSSRRAVAAARAGPATSSAATSSADARRPRITARASRPAPRAPRGSRRRVSTRSTLLARWKTACTRSARRLDPARLEPEDDVALAAHRPDLDLLAAADDARRHARVDAVGEPVLVPCGTP